MQNMLLLWINITLKGWRTILSLFRQQFCDGKVSNVTENLIPQIFYEIKKIDAISPPPQKNPISSFSVYIILSYVKAKNYLLKLKFNETNHF